MTGIACCVVHRVQRYLPLLEDGSRLWDFTPAQTVQTLRRVLGLLSVKSSQSYTLKSFRAGRATELAAQGRSIGDILRAGEWRSAAFLSYVDADAVDERQLLESTLENSDADSE